MLIRFSKGELGSSLMHCASASSVCLLCLLSFPPDGSDALNQARVSLGRWEARSSISFEPARDSGERDKSKLLCRVTGKMKEKKRKENLEVNAWPRRTAAIRLQGLVNGDRARHLAS